MWKVTGKGKVVPVLLTEHHAMEAYWGNGGIAPLILKPRHKMDVSGQLQALAAFSARKETLVPIGKEAGWAPELFRTKW